MPTAPVHPRHPTHLLESKWSRVDGALEFRHWVISEHHKTRGVVRARAVLDTDVEIELPWRELRNRTLWEPGWT